MKRSILYTALVLTTVAIATGSTTFGDLKSRTGSGGFNREHPQSILGLLDIMQLASRPM